MACYAQQKHLLFWRYLPFLACDDVLTCRFSRRQTDIFFFIYLSQKIGFATPWSFLLPFFDILCSKVYLMGKNKNTKKKKKKKNQNVACWSFYPAFISIKHCSSLSIHVMYQMLSPPTITKKKSPTCEQNRHRLLCFRHSSEIFFIRHFILNEKTDLSLTIFC